MRQIDGWWDAFEIIKSGKTYSLRRKDTGEYVSRKFKTRHDAKYYAWLAVHSD